MHMRLRHNVNDAGTTAIGIEASSLKLKGRVVSRYTGLGVPFQPVP